MTISAEVVERNMALAELDMNWARRMMPGASSDFVRLLAMHKARYEITTMPAELRHESGRFLREHFASRMFGMDLLPEGKLPE